MPENKIKSPLKTIRSYCLCHCMNNQTYEVEICPSAKCPFYSVRYGKKVPGISPLKAIKMYCTDCSERKINIEKCPFSECQLFLFRKGKNPNRKGIGRSDLKCLFTSPDPNSRSVLESEGVKR